MVLFTFSVVVVALVAAFGAGFYFGMKYKDKVNKAVDLVKG